LNRRIRKLKEEEQILSQLIEVIQIDTFQNKKMSMEEYQTALEEYQKKLSGVIEDLIEVENARAHLLKFTSKEKQLRIERKRVIEMVEDLQRNYLEKGKLETRSYELRLESYNKKLTDIDERLAVLESRMALRKKFNFFGWGKKPKKKSQGKKGKKK